MHKYLGLSLVILTLLATRTANGEERSPVPYEARVSLGARGMFPGFPGAPIMLPAIITTLDLGRFFRAQVDFSPFGFKDIEVLRLAASLGLSFKVKGLGEKVKDDFEIVIPLLGEAGYLYAYLDEKDGYDNKIEWIVLGMSTGVDFTWWFRRKTGFSISFQAAYLFIVDIDSRYYDEVLWGSLIGSLDIIIAFGVAF